MSRQFLSNESQTSYKDVRDRDVAFADLTIGDASQAKHGFLQKLPGNAMLFLNGVGQFTAPTLAGSLLALTVDPVTPVENQVWLFSDEGTPASLSIVWWHGGQRYEFPIGTAIL